MHLISADHTIESRFNTYRTIYYDRLIYSSTGFVYTQNSEGRKNYENIERRLDAQVTDRAQISVPVGSASCSDTHPEEYTEGDRCYQY
jgi:hypothetical protein